MNKQVLLFFAFIFAAVGNIATAQSTFKLTQTAYVGALSADSTQDWTKGWTNFNPNATVYPAPTDTTTLNGMLASLPIPGEKDITTTVTLDATKTYLLKGFVIVRSGGKLVIPAGTIIRALADGNSSPKNYASIVIEKGGKIEATGTAAAPIVFTSANAVGARDRGNWGGLVIVGNAPHNKPDSSAFMEGFDNVSFDKNLTKFVNSTPDANDNSGILRYVRLEFGGFIFEPNKEINGLTFCAVGAATEVSNIQVSFSNDDSFEWFGGTVNTSKIIAFKGTDDDFDTDNGFSGLNQFGIGIRDSSYYDTSYNATTGTTSTSEGFESDNDGGTSGRVPLTTAIFSNFTMIGPVPVGSKYTNFTSDASKNAFRRGARIRRNSSQRIVNSIFMGYRNFVMIDGDSCVRSTNFPAALALTTPNTAVDVKTKQISFANNLIVNTTTTAAATATSNGLVEVATATRLSAINDWVRQTGALANKIDPVDYTAGTVLVDPSAYIATPNFRPVAGSPALSGANFKDNPVLANLYAFGVANKEVVEALARPVFPNPVSDGTLFFGKEVVSYGIFDITGRLISHGFDTDRANVQGLTKGMYLIKMEGRLQKFIVQ